MNSVTNAMKVVSEATRVVPQELERARIALEDAELKLSTSFAFKQTDALFNESDFKPAQELDAVPLMVTRALNALSNGDDEDAVSGINVALSQITTVSRMVSDLEAFAEVFRKNGIALQERIGVIPDRLSEVELSFTWQNAYESAAITTAFKEATGGKYADFAAGKEGVKTFTFNNAK